MSSPSRDGGGAERGGRASETLHYPSTASHGPPPRLRGRTIPPLPLAKPRPCRKPPASSLALAVGLLLGIVTADAGWRPGGRSPIAEPIGGLWLNALQDDDRAAGRRAADHRHRRLGRGGARRPARRPRRSSCSSSCSGSRRSSPALLTPLLLDLFPLPAPTPPRRCARRSTARRAGRRGPELRRVPPLDRPDQPGRGRGRGRDPAADRLHHRLRLRADPAAGGAAPAAGRLLPGGRRHDAGDHQLGAVARPDRRVRARLCGRRPGRRPAPSAPCSIMSLIVSAVGLRRSGSPPGRWRLVGARHSASLALHPGGRRRPRRSAISTQSSLASPAGDASRRRRSSACRSPPRASPCRWRSPCSGRPARR